MRKFEIVKDEFRKHIEEKIQLPTRADSQSAGYDFYSPIDFEIKPGEVVIMPMDIKVRMQEDEVLLLFVRSSIGIKKRIILPNGTGVIDASFYENQNNDGNISGVFLNLGEETQYFKKGDRLMQGVFLKYFTTCDDIPLNSERIGGIGSSGI